VKIVFKRSFAKDLKKVRRQTLRDQVQAVIEQVEQENDLSTISQVKHLTSDGPYFRIRVGDYRIGIVYEEDTVIFVRFLHRKDIYKFFP
jgi:mRNA interferase RelE/StbE